jgi:hypothetical protein
VALSRENIIEAIEVELRPLKDRIYKPPEPRPLPAPDVIKAHVALIMRASALMPLPNWRSVRDKARRALPYVQALPTPIAASEVEALTRLTGSDLRLDELKWLCGHSAIVLIEELSARPAGLSADGNVHNIAKLLYEAATGRPVSPRGLLQSIRKAKRFRDGDLTAAPQIRVSGYFHVDR